MALALLQGCGGGGGGGGGGSTTNSVSLSATPSDSASAPPSPSSAASTSNAVNSVIAYLKASNIGSGDSFGWSVALSDDGNTLAVGAPYEDSAAANNPSGNTSTDSGAVYIFVKSGNDWVQQGFLKAQTVVAGANFGNSVALSSDGNTLAVGAPLENGSQGGTYVFTRSNNSWAQKQRVQASNAYSNALFGWSVALNDAGDTLAVGSPGEANALATINTTNHNASSAGAVYVYKYSASTWGSQQYLKATSVVASDSLGSSVALSGTGTTLAVGAPQKSGGIGSVLVYTYSSSWSAATPVSATSNNSVSGDNFGAAVALNTLGDTLAVGAPYRASNGTNSGAAYVFTKSTSWTQQDYLKDSTTETDDDFGIALALSSDGNTLVIGAIGEKGSATGINGTHDNLKDGVGAAYLFKRSGATWATTPTYIKPSVSTLGNEFGSAIGLSADGATLAISGAFEQSDGSSEQNTSAPDSGAVWLYNTTLF